MSIRRTPFPEDSVGWALPDARSTVLGIGRLGGLAELASRAGHRVVCAEARKAAAERMAGRVSAGAVCSEPTALPFASHSFDRVVIGEGLTESAKLHRSLPEIARVLRARGRVVLVLNSRDDTVPWVKRLGALVQQLDPSAMRGAYGTETAAVIEECEHFGTVATRTWRNWVPITRRGLIDMVSARPAVNRCEETQRATVLKDIGALYDASCRAPDSLMLPFQTTIWSAAADHSQLGLTAPTESLRIKIR